MPSFAHPWGLLFLPLIPPVLWWWRRSRATLRFSDLRPAARLPRGRARLAQLGGLTLRGLGLAALVIAASGPRWPDPGARVETEGIALAMVVDVSASMAERDFLDDDVPVSRLEAVKKVFRRFVAPDADLSGRPNDLIMLVVFAARPETACPLTLDHQALVTILDAQEARTLNITEATSNPGDAIAWALVALRQAPTRRKVIVFLTDGESNVPAPALTPRQAAQLAGNLGIPIYALDAAPADTDPKSDAAKARQTLEDVAKISQGKYFRAADSQALRTAAEDIDRVERDRLPTPEFRRYYEGFTWFAVAALVCWLAVVALEATIWRRVP